MKTLLIAVAVLVLVIAAPNAFAISQFQSGFNHGIQDGKESCTHSDGCHWYILQPGKGFAFHTWEFVKGYVTGFWSVNPSTSSDADQSNWDCTKGPDSAGWTNNVTS